MNSIPSQGTYAGLVPGMYKRRNLSMLLSPSSPFSIIKKHIFSDLNKKKKKALNTQIIKYHEYKFSGMAQITRYQYLLSFHRERR